MRWIWVLLALGACGDDAQSTNDARIDGTGFDVPIDGDPNNPQTLAETGLCADRACSQINGDVFPFKPHYELWSDTAAKRRWIKLPPGTQIDTSNMDYWQFPVGTKLWKEFARDGVRVETRLVMRIGANDTNQDWFYGAFVWNATQDETTLFDPFAGAPDANGTLHDVPSRPMCRACHDNTKPSRVLGFSAIQLDFTNPTAGELDLADVVALGWLTVNPNPGSGVGGYFPIPGTTYEPPALGYIHANCGHCHNPNSAVIGNTPMTLRLTVGTLTQLDQTPPYMTAVNQNATLPVGGHTKIIDPQDPDLSTMIYRFESTNPMEHMPQLGTEMMDPTGDTTLRSWIMNM